LSEAHDSGVVTARQKASGPPRVPRQTTAASGISTIRLRYSTAEPSPSPVPAGGLRRTRRGRGRSSGTRPGPDVSTSGPAAVCSVVIGYFDELDAALGVGLATVATPSFCSMPATMPVFASKNSLATGVQPPRSAMVNSFDGVGKVRP
jgi:hypothetical protein